MVMTAVTYDEMRPGCYDRDARMADFELNWVDGSLPFPTFPRFCGQTFLEATDKELGPGLRPGLQRLDGRGVVRAVRGHEHPAVHHARCGTPALAAAEIRRNAARGVRAFCFSEIPPRLGLPSIHSGDWDPVFSVCNDTGVTLCMHIGSSSTMPAASPDAPGGRGRHPGVQQRHGVAWPTGSTAASWCSSRT